MPEIPAPRPRMPFGNYKGQPIEELPDDYVDWLLSLDNIQEPLLGDLKREVEFRTMAPPASMIDIVNAGFRSLTFKYHPDHGGRNDDMRRLIESNEYLRRLVKAVEKDGR